MFRILLFSVYLTVNSYSSSLEVNRGCCTAEHSVTTSGVSPVVTELGSLNSYYQTTPNLLTEWHDEHELEPNGDSYSNPYCEGLGQKIQYSHGAGVNSSNDGTGWKRDFPIYSSSYSYDCICQEDSTPLSSLPAIPDGWIVKGEAYKACSSDTYAGLDDVVQICENFVGTGGSDFADVDSETKLFKTIGYTGCCGSTDRCTVLEKDLNISCPAGQEPFEGVCFDTCGNDGLVLDGQCVERGTCSTGFSPYVSISIGDDNATCYDDGTSWTESYKLFPEQDGNIIDCCGKPVNDGSDVDGDGISDIHDADVNGDGIIDNGTDSNGDGIVDGFESLYSSSNDSNSTSSDSNSSGLDSSAIVSAIGDSKTEITNNLNTINNSINNASVTNSNNLNTINSSINNASVTNSNNLNTINSSINNASVTNSNNLNTINSSINNASVTNSNNLNTINDSINNLGSELSSNGEALSDIRDSLEQDEHDISSFEGLGSIFDNGVGGITSSFSSVVNYNLGVPPVFQDSSSSCSFSTSLSYGTFEFPVGETLDTIRPHLDSLWSFLFIYVSFLMYYKGFIVVSKFL